MKKVQLSILGLSYSQSQSGAYALILGEVGGKRRLPIIIGSFEAQAIALELEKITPSRPLTHDLIKIIATNFNINITEVIIYGLSEGIFQSKLVCESNGFQTEIEARTSDAVAIAVRFKCPIYTYESIISSAGIIIDENEQPNIPQETPTKNIPTETKKEITSEFSHFSDKELNDLLQKAIEEEAYEKASKIRDEINLRKKK